MVIAVMLIVYFITNNDSVMIMVIVMIMVMVISCEHIFSNKIKYCFTKRSNKNWKNFFELISSCS